MSETWLYTEKEVFKRITVLTETQTDDEEKETVLWNRIM